MSEEIYSNPTDSAKPVIEQSAADQSAAEVSVASDVTEQKQPEPTKELFESLMSKARNALVDDKLEDAIVALGEAAEMSAELFEPLASEAFAPHFLFGKSVLELAFKEQEDIVEKLAGDGADKEAIVEEFREDIKEVVKKFAGSLAETFGETLDDAVEEDKTALTLEPIKEFEPSVKEAIQEAVAQNSEPKKQDESAATLQDESSDTLQDEEGEGNDPDDEDEDVDAMQLAFEFLEHALLICKKHTGSSDALTWLKREKDTLLLLAQLAIADGRYKDAAKELMMALEIVKVNFSKELRESAFIRVELAHVYRKLDDHSSANVQIDSATEELKKFKTEIQFEVVEIDGLLEELAEQKNSIEKTEVMEQDESVVHPNADAVSNEVKAVESSAIKRPAKAEEGENGLVKKVKFAV